MRNFGTRYNAGSRRGGYNLIEMVVVISMMGVLMSLGVVLLGLLMRADTSGQRALAGQLSVSRLERQFRADAHAAVAVTAAGDAHSLELQRSDGQRVIWAPSESGVERRAYDGDSVSARDEYKLPAGDTRFGSDASGRLVEVRRDYRMITPTETPAEDSVAPQYEWRIQAAVGLAVIGPAAAAPSETAEEP